TARRLASYMFGAGREQEFAALLDKPKPWLQRHEAGVRDQRDREMAIVALARLARHDMLEGYAYFRKVWVRHLPSADAAWVQAHFALLAALRQNSVAPQWYVGTDEAVLGEYNAEWRVRAALRATS